MQGIAGRAQRVEGRGYIAESFEGTSYSIERRVLQSWGFIRSWDWGYWHLSTLGTVPAFAQMKSQVD